MTNLTSTELDYLIDLVTKYGMQHIIDLVEDIGCNIAEDEYNEAVRREDAKEYRR